MTEADSERFTWSARFPDFEGWWNFETLGGVYGELFNGLDDATVAKVRTHMAEQLERCRGADGAYLIPTTTQIVWGRR